MTWVDGDALTPANLNNKSTGPWINVLDIAYNTTGNGTTNDRAAIAVADAAAVAADRPLLFPSGTYAIASNITIAAAVLMLPGATLLPASGITVTLTGAFSAGRHHVFDISSSGGVAFGIGAAACIMPEWFGARNDYDGSAPKRINNASFFQAAITSMAAEGALAGTVGWQLDTQGQYWFSSGFTVNRHRVHIEGKGRHVSVFHFAPAAAATCVKFDKGASAELFEGSMRGVGFRGEGSAQKIAIDMVDVSDIDIADISMQAWTGNSGSASTPSIGIKAQGRELVHINNVSIVADRPIQISANPNNAIGCDFLHMSNTYLLPQVATEYAITIDNNVNVYNLLIDGNNIWALGRGGLYWVDTTTGGGASQASSIRIENVRLEQQQDVDGYGIRIERAGTGSPVYDVLIKNFIPGNNQHGVRLRRAFYTVLDSVRYTGGADATRLIYDLDTTCKHVEIRNGCATEEVSYSLGGLNILFSMGQAADEKAPAWAILDETARTPVNFGQDRFKVISEFTPSASNSAGGVGEVCFDDNYIYYCYADYFWKRAALSTW